MLVQHSGIDPLDFKSYKVTLDTSTDGEADYMWTYEVGNEDETHPTLVLLHGYAASGMIFYRCFPYLAEHFHLILVDLPGMGRSSRHHFDLEEPDEIEQYLIDALESWRDKMQLKEMYLCGHSFGGYLSTIYALQFEHRVKKLLLFSPVGVPPQPEDFTFEKKMEGKSWKMRNLMKLVRFMWTREYSFQGALRKLGRGPASLCIKKFVGTRMKKCPDD